MSPDQTDEVFGTHRENITMSLDFSSLFWIFIAIMVLQPLFMGRWYALRRAQAIRAIEKSHASRVITMIHRQEKRSVFGFAVSRHIDLARIIHGGVDFLEVSGD